MTSRVTEHLMRICASRLDARITADEFVAMLNTLVEWSFEAGRNQATDEPAAAGDAEPGGLDSSAGGESGPPRKDTPAHIHRARRRGTRKIDDATRDEIRIEAEQAKDSEGKLPRGFVAGLATEHGVSDQTIYNILAD